MLLRALLECVQVYVLLHSHGRLLLRLSAHTFPVSLELHSRDPKTH